MFSVICEKEKKKKTKKKKKKKEKEKGRKTGKKEAHAVLEFRPS